MTEDYKEAAIANDVIDKFKAYLLSNQVATVEEMNALEVAVAARIEQARKFAEEAPLPDVKSVLDYNYSCDNERSVNR